MYSGSNLRFNLVSTYMKGLLYTLTVGAVAIWLMWWGTTVGFSQEKKITIDWQNEAMWHQEGQEALAKAALEQMNIEVQSFFNNVTTVYQGQMRIALTSNLAPALFDWWFGYRMRDLIEAGLAADLTSIWEKHIANGEYDRSLISSFGYNGKFYAIPKMINYWPIFYDKSVFAQYGLQIPQNWSEFTGLMEKLKSHGIIPMALPTGWGSWISMTLFCELMVRYDPQVYVELMEGEIKYNDPRVIVVMEIWKDLLEKGYVGGLGLDLDTMVRAFAQNEIGMAYLGDWWLPIAKGQGIEEEDMGMFVMPGITEKGSRSLIYEGRPTLLGAKSPFLEQALEFADYAMSVPGSTVFAEVYPGFNSPNLKVAESTRPPLLRKLTNEIAAGKYDLYIRYWEATPAVIVDQVVELLMKFIQYPDTLEEVFDEATKIADSYWAE